MTAAQSSRMDLLTSVLCPITLRYGSVPLGREIMADRSCGLDWKDSSDRGPRPLNVTRDPTLSWHRTGTSWKADLPQLPRKWRLRNETHPQSTGRSWTGTPSYETTPAGAALGGTAASHRNRAQPANVTASVVHPKTAFLGKRQRILTA